MVGSSGNDQVLSILAGIVAIAGLWLWQSARNRSEAIRVNVCANDRNDKRTRQPLEVLYPIDQADRDVAIDIVAVHGLGSNVDWSWTWKEGGKQINWLQDPDMLPAKVPKARILAYNYQSEWHADAPKTRLQLCGETLVHSLHSFRADAPDRPILFIGHSLGGNVIVNSLLYAISEDRFSYFPKATVGIVFLGTPLRGTRWKPFVDSVAWLMQLAGSHRGITRELDFDEPVLLDRLHGFCGLRNRLSIPVSCFSELHETDFGRRFGIHGLVRGIVVEEASACIPGLDRHCLQTDHLKINKYNGPTDRSFIMVSDAIVIMCANAGDVVQRRQNPVPMVADRRNIPGENPEVQDCIRSLFVTDPLEDRTALKRKKGSRAHGTCQWILGTEELTVWLGSSPGTAGTNRQTSNILWLHGNPGTGKSTMSIFLTEELSTTFSATDGPMLAYFFCDAGVDKQRTATAVIRGLLLQLIQQRPQLLEHVLPKYRERESSLFNSFDAIWSIFMAIAADQSTGPKYCIIDALDECEEQSQRTLLRQFQETFTDPHASSNIRILVTSRPYPEMRRYLEPFPNRDLASFPEVEGDIKHCIDERVASLSRRNRFTAKIQRQVSDILKEKSQGTFLWVGLACEELQEVASKDAVRLLESMPQGLHSLYEGLLGTALGRQGRGCGMIRRILSLVVVCIWPLSVLELSELCRLHEEEEDIETRVQFVREQIAACRLMVVIRDDRVLLLHQSVRDYLTGTSSVCRIDELEAHAEACYSCIDLLMRRHRGGGHQVSTYAMEQWAEHARLAQSRFRVRASEAGFFAAGSPSWAWWLGKVSYSKLMLTRRGVSVLHIAARCGIPALIDHVVGQYRCGLNLGCVDDEGFTPLEYALWAENTDIVSILLGLGAEVSKGAVELAALGTRESMEMLLDQRENEVAITQDVLRWATENDNSEVLAMLLDRLGAQGHVDVSEDVLKTAAANPNSQVLAVLLETPDGVKAITEGVLMAAATSYAGDKTLALLLERGRGVVVTDAMREAAQNAHARELLCERLQGDFDSMP